MQKCLGVVMQINRFFKMMMVRAYYRRQFDPQFIANLPGLIGFVSGILQAG